MPRMGLILGIQEKKWKFIRFCCGSSANQQPTVSIDLSQPFLWRIALWAPPRACSLLPVYCSSCVLSSENCFLRIDKEKWKGSFTNETSEQWALRRCQKLRCQCHVDMKIHVDTKVIHSWLKGGTVRKSKRFWASAARISSMWFPLASAFRLISCFFLRMKSAKRSPRSFSLLTADF